MPTTSYVRLTAGNVGRFAPDLTALHLATTGQVTAPEHWIWRYGDSAEGPSTTTLALRGGRVIGKYGSVAFPFRCRGARTTAHLMDGLHVLRECRSWEVYRSLIQETARALGEAGPRPSYAFANRMSGKLNRMLGWESAAAVPVFAGFLDFASALRQRRRIGGLALPFRVLNPLLKARAPLAGEWEIRMPVRLDPSFDECLARGAAATGVVKDHRYLNWRYADCPSGYRLLAAFRGGRPEACLAYLVSERYRELRLKDLLGGEGTGAPLALVGEALRTARREGCSLVRASFPLGSWQGRLLISLGFQRWPTLLVGMTLFSFSEDLPVGEFAFSYGDWL